MLAAIDESHSPYDPLHVKQLEDCGFLESVVPGLSTYADKPSQPDMTEDMEMAPPIGMEGEELYEDYRKHMSYKYNKFSGRMDDTDSS
ncbi:hypothetical protein FBU59_000414 [Linderina macrospora]|uniref:Uncharacterized protein n=1 Tax=Linderina macrospora TaxID=4868 RepID=A0ACC1JH62_9FUNG|nr:hypothetical protein FBU59_000414 [Linderina macrospora]